MKDEIQWRCPKLKGSPCCAACKQGEVSQNGLHTKKLAKFYVNDMKCTLAECGLKQNYCLHCARPCFEETKRYNDCNGIKSTEYRFPEEVGVQFYKDAARNYDELKAGSGFVTDKAFLGSEAAKEWLQRYPALKYRPELPLHVSDMMYIRTDGLHLAISLVSFVLDR